MCFPRNHIFITQCKTPTIGCVSVFWRRKDILVNSHTAKSVSHSASDSSVERRVQRSLSRAHAPLMLLASMPLAMAGKKNVGEIDRMMQS